MARFVQQYNNEWMGSLPEAEVVLRSFCRSLMIYLAELSSDNTSLSWYCRFSQFAQLSSDPLHLFRTKQWEQVTFPTHRPPSYLTQWNIFYIEHSDYRQAEN